MESIFYKLVTGEDSYTQLLRNLMIRSDDFRRRVLGVLFQKEEWTLQIVPNIETQVDLSGCGRADMVIRTDKLYAIVEVKLCLWCGLTGNQDPAACEENELKGYIGHLRGRKEADRRLVFLVPDLWIHRETLQEWVNKNTPRETDVQIRVVTWEDVLLAMESSASDPFVDELRKLLDDLFGPIEFLPEEVRMLQNEDFPVAFHTVRKVQFVVERIATDYLKKGDYKFEWGREKEEYGLYIKQGNEYILWFGMWDKPLQKYGASLSVAVSSRKEWNLKAAAAFSDCFTKGTTGEIEDEGAWIVSWISNEALQSSDPVKQVWKQLEPILERLRKASQAVSR